MKNSYLKKILAVMTAAAVAVTPLSGSVFASGNAGGAEARDGSVLETAIASYDFNDYTLAGETLTYGGSVLKLEKQGSGVLPSLVNDSDPETGRGQVLQIRQNAYENRGYAVLPENPFEGLEVDNGFTLSFWTSTTAATTTGDGLHDIYNLIDFEVYPAAGGSRAGTFAVNQSKLYWNTTDQNSYYIDTETYNLGLSTLNRWTMYTVILTTDGIEVYGNGRKIQTSVTASNTSNYEQLIRDVAGELLDEGQETVVRLGASMAEYWSSAGALLDDISFYDRALTAAEVSTLYDETKIRIPLNTITISGDAVVEQEKTMQLTAAYTPSNTNAMNEVVWTSSNEDILTVDNDGVVTGVSPGKATVTAAVARDNVTSNVFEITVISPVRELEPGYYLAVYSTTTDFYASTTNVPQETRSVYMAASKDGKTFDVLNNGGGVIFSKNTSGTLQVTDPRIFKTKDGFTVTAPDYTSSRGIHVFTSKNGVHYYDDTLVASTELEASSLDKDSFTLMLNGQNILKTDRNITLGNAVALTEEEYTYITDKLGTVLNNGLEELDTLEIDSQAGLTVSNLEELYPSVNATYTDGSLQKFNIDWSGALDHADLTKEGTYTLTGNVVQTQYLNKLKEINGSTLPEDDPDNVNPNYSGNYNHDTGETLYDKTKFVEGMADPNIFWDEKTGYYYMTGSYFPEKGDEIDVNDNTEQYDRVVLRKAKTLEGLQDRSKQVTIWKVGNQGYESSDGTPVTSGYRYIWAPEIHRVGDYWVVYFTESHGGSNTRDTFDIYCHALILDGNQDPYETALKSSNDQSVWKDYQMSQANIGPIDSLSEAFCLDMTYFEDEVSGKSYVIWAGKPTISFEGRNTDLFIAEVNKEKPYEVTSETVRMTWAEYGWERIRYCVAEGATILQKDGNIYMSYSVSGTGSEYAIGLMQAKNGTDLLNMDNWIKSPYPLLTSRDVDGEEGPGHNSFTVDQDGNEIFVYHARPTSHNHEKCGWDGEKSTFNREPLNDPCRHARLKRVHWSADGTPILKMTYEEELLEEYSTVSVEVKVTKAVIPATAIRISGSNQVEEGKTVQLSASITPANTTQKDELVWQSSNETVLKVDKNGKVTGIKSGVATVTASIGNVTSDEFEMTVAAPSPADNVILNKKKASLKVGQTLTLKAAASGKVTYKSSNTKVAKVNAAGKVTAVKSGTATITAACGTATDTCKITVKKDKITVSSVKVGKKKVKASNKTINAAKGQKIVIKMKRTNTVKPLKVSIGNPKAVKKNSVKNNKITLKVKKAVKKKVKVTIKCGTRKVVRYIKTK